MSEFGLINVVVVPIGLGLVGFIEPCSIGSSLIFIKYLEGKGAAAKLGEVSVFAATRAVFIGVLGMLAVLLGTAFLGLQKAAWIFLGGIYISLGILYLAGKASLLMVALGPSIVRLSGARGPAALGILFGLNIPACATPLIFALLGAAVASGATGATLAAGFTSLALFGGALSLPLVLAVVFEPVRRALDWLSDLSRRLPVWTGLLLIVLGLWSIGFALFLEVKA
ncbi:MAG: cytochrome c biogenesis protein CcdA [Candidatus Rokuibacteriota bacterium]